MNDFLRVPLYAVISCGGHDNGNVPPINIFLGGSPGTSQQYREIHTAANMAAVKVVESDVDFQKQIKANKFVLAIFMEDDTEIEVWFFLSFKQQLISYFAQANLIDLQKQLKNVSFRKVPPSKNPEAVSEYDIEDHELPTFLFIEVKVCQEFRIQ